MPVPNVIATAIPIALPVARMLRYDVVPPVRRKIISAANLARAISALSQIPDRAISRVRELRRTIAAIDISGRELTCADRRASIGINVVLTIPRRAHPNR
jgi:hypothetical protein